MSNDQDGNIADIDFSVIRTAIEIGGKPIEQVLNGVHYGSPEVRCLLLDECELIIECKVCRALFRALPLFVAHKRVYCTKSFQESQPPLFETIVTDETVVVQPTAPEDDDESSKSAPAQEAPSPEAHLNQLVEQIQAGKAGNSEEYKFYSNVAGLVEKRKELGKTTMNLELKAIPTNRNAVMVNLTEAVTSNETRNEVSESSSAAPEVKSSSKLETVLTQKILPKCKNESVIKSKCDVSAKNSAGGKTQTQNSEATVISASKTKECVVADASSTSSKEKGAGTAVVEKPNESETKSVAKQPTTASRVSAREKKPSIKTRVTELPETDETLDLSSLKCLKCHMSYSSKKTLLYHFQMRHSQLRTFFPCPYCSNIFFYFWGLTRHMMKIHKKSKNQIDKMRDKLRKRAFTKCITKSCNIAKDQLQFIADDDDDTHMVDKGVSEETSTSKLSKQQAASSQSSKSSSKAKASSDKNAKGSFVNDYETPKLHREPRISLKEGLRNSKDKQNDSRKAVVKRQSDSPRSRNPTWAEVNTKGRGMRKSISPKSISDEDPSPKSKEKALDELQKKLTEAATVPIVTRSSSSERLHSESRSSSLEWKNDTGAFVRGNETKIDSSESRRKPAEATAGSSAVTEKRPVVSGSLEKTRLFSECSPGKNKKQDASELSLCAKKDEIILGSRLSEPSKSTFDRPGARRRQIQIGTTVGPRMLSEKLLSVENKDLTEKHTENTNNKLGSSKANTNEASVSDKQGVGLEGKSGTQKLIDERSESGQELSDREADESRGRSSRRRTPTAKAQTSSTSVFQAKNENTERKSDKNYANKPQSKVVNRNERTDSRIVEKVDGQEKHLESDKRATSKVPDSSNIEDSKSRLVKCDIQKTLNAQTKAVSKDKIQKNANALETRSSTAQGKDGQLNDDSSPASVQDVSCVEVSSKRDNAKSESSERKTSSRSASVERTLRSMETSAVKTIAKEPKQMDVRCVGETTMRLFASPPGSKPLIKHSRIKKMNEFVVRCIPQSSSTPITSPSGKAPVDTDADQHLDGEASGIESEEDNNTSGKRDVIDSTNNEKTTSESSPGMDKDMKVMTNKSSSGLEDCEEITNETLGKDNAADSVNADDDCSVISSEDNARSSAGTPTPRIRSFRCGCGRRFSCKVGFANHRRACDVKDSSLCQVPTKVEKKKAISDADDKNEDEEKNYPFVCQCGKRFEVKVGLSNHQRACLKEDAKNTPETEAKKLQKDSADININTGESRDCSAKSIFSMQSSFELFSCDKCNRVFGRKVSFINHQQNCTEKKCDKEDQSNRLSAKDSNSSVDKKDTPIKTSSTRRKFPARKLSASRNDAANSDDESLTPKGSSSLRNTSTERSSENSLRSLAPHRKRSNSGRLEVDEEQEDPPEKQFRVIEEIWVDKVPGKPVEKVKSNRIYVMEAKGGGKLHCQDTKKLCDIADERNMKCRVCLQEFSSMSNLRRHAIRHLGWRRYKCKMCRFSSYNKSECNTHIIRTHADKLRSAAATEYMIIDLNKEASRVRTQKKKQTLIERKAVEMERSPQGRYHQSHSRLRHHQKMPQRVPEDRKKPAVREENIHNPIAQNTFNISTRNSPRKFDTRPYRMVDQMSTLCTRKSYYVKSDQQVAADSGNSKKKRSLSSTPTAEASEEKTDGSSAKQKRGSSISAQEMAEEEKDNNEGERDKTGDEEKQEEVTHGDDKMADFESMSDTESVTRSKSLASRKHRISVENKDTGYASDSCLASHRSPSRGHSKTYSVSSESSVQKHRKLSGGSSSSDKSSTAVGSGSGSGSGSRPLTMMSIQDMFELIKPKPKPERKSVGDIATKSVVKTTSNKSDVAVRRVSLEGAVVTRKQADAVSQATDKEKTSSGKESSARGNNPS